MRRYRNRDNAKMIYLKRRISEMRKMILPLIISLAFASQVFAESPTTVETFINNTTAELGAYSGNFAISSDAEAVTINFWGNVPEEEIQRIATEKYSEVQSLGMHLRVNLLDENNLDKVLGQYYDGSETIEIEVSSPSAAENPENAGVPAEIKTFLLDGTEEPLIWEQDGVKITAKKIEKGGWSGTEVYFLIENESGRNITVQTRDTSVNGYMVDSLMSAEVATGKKINDSMTISDSDLKRAGIDKIADIETRFHVFDADTWDEMFDTELIRLETEEAEGYEYKFDDSGNQIYNENGVEIVVKGLSEEESWYGTSVVVYINNMRDRAITVQTRDTSINGFMINSLFSCDVSAGKHAIDTITFSSSELEENGIETINDLELSFHIFNSDDWETIVDTAPMTINFAQQG